MGLLTAIVVAELGTPPTSSNASSSNPAQLLEPRFVLVLPHGDPARLPKNVLSFCFPDLDELLKRPFAYVDLLHGAEEYTFTLTPKDDARLHGYCRRYRIGAPEAGGRIDFAPSHRQAGTDAGGKPALSAAADSGTASSATGAAAAETPVYQCICILSERCVCVCGCVLRWEPPHNEPSRVFI